MDEHASVALIHALARVWSAIRRNHPETPPVVVLAAPAARRGVLGHFAPLRWSTREDDGELLHEVVVVAEYLDRDPKEIVETLLHEAAHALNFARGIRDCSRSQYHNRMFKAAAEELGLEVVQVKHYGFALTLLPEPTALRYEDVTDALTKALLHRRSFRLGVKTPTNGGGSTTATPDKKPTGRSRKATCPCGFIIRASKKTLSSTTIRCDTCQEPFVLAIP